MDWIILSSEAVETFCKPPTIKSLSLGPAEYRAIFIATFLIAFFTGKRLMQDFSKWFGKKDSGVVR